MFSVQDTKSLEFFKLISGFYHPWECRNQYKKTEIKEMLDLIVMPKEISWFYLACAKCQQLLRNGVVMSDFFNCYYQVIERALKINLLPNGQVLARNFANKIYQDELQLAPKWPKNYEVWFNSDLSILQQEMSLQNASLTELF